MTETVLQFGAGNFLRAFADLFIEQANRTDRPVGRIVVVQSTSSGRGDTLNARGCRYQVAVRGFSGGKVVDELEAVSSISRALAAATAWPEVLAFAASPGLRIILSNTTEAGYVIEPGEVARGAGAPVSFPAKLADVLWTRWSAGCPGVTVIPCELHEQNAAKLRALVESQLRAWSAPEALFRWLATECRWINTLVDRIVPGTPKDHPALADDPLLISAEPFAFWAMETTDAAPFAHPAIVTAADISPYYLRKVRILNGAHTALVAYAMPRGFKTVREAIENPEVGAWLRRVLDEEIVPVLEGRVDDPAGFARTTLERFMNPFLEHQLSAIALNHAAKIEVRLRPTMAEYETKFGCPPPLLTAALAG
jgi:tagaturonate reductase